MDKKLQRVCSLILQLYSLPTGSTGGYADSVIDDENVDTNSILSAIDYAINCFDEDTVKQEVRIKSIIVLAALLELKEWERHQVVQSAYSTIQQNKIDMAYLDANSRYYL